jgi:hypothetical protein
MFAMLSGSWAARKSCPGMTPARLVRYRGDVRDTLVVLCLVAACSSRSSGPAADHSGEAPGAASHPLSSVVASTDARAPDALLESHVLGVVPAVAGPSAEISEDQTVQLGPLAITHTYTSHRHGLRDVPARSTHYFRIAGPGGAVEVQLAGGDEAEVVADGALVTFHVREDDTFRVVLAAERAPAALTLEACRERIGQVADRAKLERSTSHGWSEQDANGIVYYHEATWHGFCGMYTRRVWFTRREPPSGPYKLR